MATASRDAAQSLAAGGQALDQIESGSAWWRGDWWNAGKPYGERVATANDSETKVATYRNCGWVASVFEDVSLRNDTLTFDHHRHVAALLAQERKHWLDRAEAEGWSAAKMKSAIAQAAGAGGILTDMASTRWRLMALR
jgi:hypothetical protein